MKKKIINIVKKIGIAGIVTTIIVNVISHKIEDINYFELLQKMCNESLEFIKSIINFELPIWGFLIFIILLIIMIKIYVKLQNIKNESIESKWDKYKTEKYEGLIYSWEYWDDFGEKKIRNLKPICECGCDLLVRDSYQNRHTIQGFLVCPNCGKAYRNNFRENKEAVSKIIVYKHNKMIEEYKKKNNSNKEIDIKNLNKNEKEIIHMFYNSHLKKYSNKKIAIDADKFNNDIDDLVERGILKEQNEYELIENYTSNGTLFEMTESAIKKLNNK